MSLIPQPANLVPQPANVDQLPKYQGDNRGVIRRADVASSRQRNEADAAANPAVENLNGLVRRVAGTSMEEIERVILELQNVRDMLRREGQRVSREIVGYADLNHAAMSAMQVIGDNLKQWKDAGQHNRHSG